ncbi:MAG: tetratricopeptide repeat protein [Nitrospirota bacterium]|jgi:tetratricopeptide (TPR) repeat protein
MVKFVVLVFVLCVGALALLAMSNTDNILVTIPFYKTYELSKIALILISSGSGALLVLFLFIVRDTRRMVSAYQVQKKQKKEEKIQGLYSRAMNAMLADNLAEARAYLEDILKVEREHAQAMMRLGDMASREERHDEALRQYKKALTASDDDLERIEALFALAALSERLERWTDALEYVENILEKDPENLGAMYLKRSVMEHMGRWGELIELQKTILKAEQKAGHDTKKEETVLNGYRYEQARADLEQGQAEKAGKAFRNIIKADEKFVPAYMGASEVLLKEGDSEEAVRFLEKGYHNTSSLILLAAVEDLLINMNEPSRLIRLYRDVLASAPQNNMLRFMLGKLYYRLEMVDDALETLSAEVPEDYPQWNELLGELFLRRNQCEQAVEEFKKTIDFKKTLRLPYCCSKCGREDDDWSGRCPSCGRWNTYEFNLHGACKI